MLRDLHTSVWDFEMMEADVASQGRDLYSAVTDEGGDSSSLHGLEIGQMC